MFIEYKNKTATYWEAFRVLHKLIEESGLNMARIVYADVMAEKIKEEYFKRKELIWLATNFLTYKRQQKGLFNAAAPKKRKRDLPCCTPKP